MYSRLRQIFVIVLLCTNLMLGFLSYGLLRELNSGYSSLVGQSIPVLAKLHEVTLLVMRSYRAAAQAAIAPTSETRKAEFDRAIKLHDEATRVRMQYQRAPDLVNGAGIDWPLEAAARDYDERFQHYLGMLRNGEIDQASGYRTGTLWPAADHYYEVLDQRVTQLEERAGKLSQGYAASHSLWRNVILTLGSWPIAIVAILIVGLGGLTVAVLATVFYPRIGRLKDT